LTDPDRAFNAITGGTSQVWGVDTYENFAFIVSDNGYLTIMEFDLFDIDPGPSEDLRPRPTGMTETYDLELLIPDLEGNLALPGVAGPEYAATAATDDVLLFVSLEVDGEGQKRRVAGLTIDGLSPTSVVPVFTSGDGSVSPLSAAAPEPATGLLLALGGFGLLGRSRNRRRSR